MKPQLTRVFVSVGIVCWSLLIQVTAQGTPNLRPFRPATWSDRIVVSNTSGTTVDSVSLSSADSIFIDWAVLNDGTGPTSVSYSVILQVDGQTVGVWSSSPPHKPNFYRFVEDFEIEPLSPGNHTLVLVADSNGDVVELNESDNSFSKTISVTEALPNLRPFRPSGWSDPLVISSQTGTDQDSSLFEAGKPVFIDWAVINDGTGPTDKTYNVALLLNNETVGTWSVDPPHNVRHFRFIEDFNLGLLQAGTYSLKLIADSSGVTEESNETDNTFSKNFTVKEELPNLTPFQPTGWSNRIVVSSEGATNEDSGSLVSTDTLFVDWAVVNDGNGPTSSSYLVTLSVDGKNQLSWIANPPHNANFFVFVEDFQLGSLSPGTHTLTIKADSASAVEESNESDNVFSRQIEIQAAPDGAQEVFIYFPRIQEDGSSASGIAIANPTDESAEVELLLIDNDGNLVEGAGIVNPASLTIPSGSQIARTVPGLFGQAVGEVEGWIQASSENLGIVGFFLTFSQDIISQNITRIDGAEATVFPATGTVVFPEILAGEDSFTEISVIGAGPIDLDLYDKDGTLVETQKIELPTDVFGRFSGKLDEIFSTPLFSDGYVLARSKQFRIMGYEHFGSDSFLAGRNAIPVSGVGRDLPIALFGAQLVDIPAIQSMITIINPTDTSAELTISAFETGSSDGTPEASKTTSLAPRSMLRVDARSFLDLPSGDFAGWLRVDSDVAGIIGDVTFGDPNGNFLSSVQLQNSPVRDVIFSHLADGLGFLTGLTLLNTNADPAAVMLEVFNVDGERTGIANLILEPFEHRPRLLSEFIPGFEPQIGGYIRLTSDIGIFSFELFLFVSSGKVISLAAVPPQRGQGAIAGQVTPVSIGSSSQQSLTESQFEASQAKGIHLDLNAEFVPGEMIVRFYPGSRSDELLRLSQHSELRVAALGGNETYLLRSSGAASISFLELAQTNPSGLQVLKEQTLFLIEELNADPNVLYAEPNYIYHSQTIPNDPHYGLQWHYPNVDLPSAWDITTGDPNVVVAVIDTGAKFSHPDLGPRLTGGQFDFIRDPQNALDGDGIDPNADDPGSDPRGVTSSFHGTHVAGTIGAVTNNGIGVAGVNWFSPLMTLRALGKEGSGTLFDISQAIRYASGLPNVSGRVPTQKANVINMSLGGPGFSRTMADALAAGQSEGVVVVGSAGNNDSNELNYPASHEGVISVGATDLSGGKAPYSSFGSRIDVVAPGGNLAEDRNADEYGDGVLSTLWNEDRDEPLYRFYQGTSMAAPHVAGVVSLMLSVNPNLSPSQVRQILQETAIDLGPPGKDNTFGFGLIDPVAALKAAGALTPQNPQLVVSTKTMNFGDSLEQSTATISNGGGGTLQVNTPTVEMDQASNWLSAIVSGSTLIATVNRAGLNSGFYTGRIQLTSNGGNVTIEVQMQVGEEPQADVGTIFVIAVDPTTFETIEAISTSLDTDFTFEIPPVAAGVYFVIAGTDLDNDGFICDEGEFCGLYPVSNEASLVGVTANEITPNIDFTVEEDAFQNSTSMSESVNRQVGFRIFQNDSDRFTLLKQRPNRLSSAELPLDVTGFEVVTEEE